MSIREIVVCFMVLMLTTLNCDAQRNRLTLIGLRYDNVLGQNETENNMEVISLNKWNLYLGYERAVGNHITLGLKYHYYFQPDEYEYYTLRIDNPIDAQKYDFGIYSETIKHGFAYECTYYFSGFDDSEIEGAYLTSTLMVNSASQIQTKETPYSAGGANINSVQSFENDYLMYRYGIRLGIKALGDLYVGYMFTLANPSRNTTDTYQNWNPISPGNLVIGYNYGFSF